MPSKEQYEKVFNQLLGTDIKWSKLSKDELAQLAILFNNPEVLLKKLGIKADFKTQAAREKLVEAGIELLESWEGPLANIAKRMIGIDNKEK